MPKPILSVVIPALNEEKLIAECIKHLKNQTLDKSKYEIIVCDTHSIDNTYKIAKKHADKVVTCPKQGAGHSRNVGARAAKGKYLAFVDADTFVCPQWAEGVIEGLDKGVVATGPSEDIEKDSLKLSLFYKWWSIQSWIGIKINIPTLPGYNTAVRKKTFDEVGGFVDKDMISEDIELGEKLKKKGKFIFVWKMRVKTSNRRVKEMGVIRYMLHGIEYMLFKKEIPWSKHRRAEDLRSKK